jgi:hypothetical protein
MKTIDGRTFRSSPATIWVCHETGDVVVTGTPESVTPPGRTEDNGHNCDMAGCPSLDHVLARGRVVGIPEEAQ